MQLAATGLLPGGGASRWDAARWDAARWWLPARRRSASRWDAARWWLPARWWSRLPVGCRPVVVLPARWLGRRPGGMPPGGGYPPPGGAMPPGGMPPGGMRLPVVDGGPGGMPAGAQPRLPAVPVVPMELRVAPGYGPMGGGQPPKKGGKGLLIGGIIGGRRSRSGVIIGAVIFCLLGGSDRKISSKAHEHLPDSCDAVIRVDIKRSARHVDSVKEHVMPVLDKKAKESEDAGKRREVSCMTAGPRSRARTSPRRSSASPTSTSASPAASPTWWPSSVAIIVDGGILDAIDKHGDKDKWAKKSVEEGRSARHRAQGRQRCYVTQADDAALIISKQDGACSRTATKTR